jgi:hypothetical protein
MDATDPFSRPYEIHADKPLKLSQSIASRLFIAAICVAATQAAIWNLQRHTALLAAQAEKFDVDALPLELGAWAGTAAELDPGVFKQVGALSMTNRRYSTEAGRQAAVHLATYATSEMLVPHPPNLCLTGSGWTILKDGWHNDRDRRYRLMLIERDGMRAAVAYWYQLGTDVAADRNDLRKILQKFRRDRTSWPPMVKVLLQAPVIFSEDDAIADCRELGAAIYEWVKDAS